MNECCQTIDLLSLEDAIALLQRSLQPITESATLPLLSALNHTLARPVIAPCSVPPLTSSAMDGYALSADSDLHTGSHFQIVGTSSAGRPWTGTLLPMQAVRIMTGAAVPAGATAVVMQESAVRTSANLVLSADVSPGEHIRPAGDDIQQGSMVLTTGTTLTPSTIAALAALGKTTVEVIRPLRVALATTGNELHQPGRPLNLGGIYDSNSTLLKALLRSLPVIVTDLGILPDNPSALRQAFAHAAKSHDVLISTGGVSVGDTDHTGQVLADLGTVDFWKLALKPGKPMAFGRIDQAYFFGLPGNPVGAMVTAQLLVLPALGLLLGHGWRNPLRFPALTTTRINKKSGRLDVQRAQIIRRADGQWLVTPVPQQGSHQLTGLMTANAYALLPAEASYIPENTLVDVIPFSLNQL